MKDAETALNFLAERLEEAGVFIAISDIVGNDPRRPLIVSQCRGFALVNKIAPYIFVNSSDSACGQIYTLINMCVHLMLGLSAGHAGQWQPLANSEEMFCGQVTMEFLMPRNKFQKRWNHNFTSCSIKKNLTSKSGDDPYLTNLKRIGQLFALHIYNAVQNRQLSYTQAYRLTGLCGSSYQNFMTKLISQGWTNS